MTYWRSRVGRVRFGSESSKDEPDDISQRRLEEQIRAEKTRLGSSWFLSFEVSSDESAFLTSVIAKQIKELALRSWAFTTAFWIYTYVASYVQGRYLINGEMRAATKHVLGFQILQLVFSQTFLVIRFLPLPPRHIDTLLFLSAFLIAITIPMSNPWRVGKWYQGDACIFTALYSDSPCPGANWSDHYYLLLTLAVYILITCLLPVREKWSACFGLGISAMYFLTSFPEGWSPHSHGQVVFSTTSMIFLTFIIWVGQRRREFKDRLEWLRVRELIDEIEQNVSGSINPAETSALHALEEAIRWGNKKEMTSSRSSLSLLGWSPGSLDEKECSIRKRHSETFGVSVKYLVSKTFTEIVQRSTKKDDPTFHDISNAMFIGDDAIGKNTVCPRDGKQGCSYLDTLAPEHKGECTHFLSWSWSYKLSIVQSGLNHWIDTSNLDPENTYLWMCFFVNNQHRILNESSRVSNGSDNLEEAFETNLLRIKKLVALLDTWIRPEYLTRIWCIFEQYTAIRLKLEITMILPETSADTFLHEIERGKEGILLVKDNLSKVDSEHAKASVAADETKVKRLIEESVGFDTVNKRVMESMIKWMSLEVKHYLSSLMADDQFDMTFTSTLSHGPKAQVNSSRRSMSAFCTSGLGRCSM